MILLYCADHRSMVTFLIKQNMETFIEKLKKTSYGSEFGLLRFPNGYAVEITRESFYVQRKDKVYNAILFQYTKPSGYNNDFKCVYATYTATYEGINVKNQKVVKIENASEENVTNFIEQVRVLPAICEVPNTWDD
jgi:hypothetical protein